MEEEAKTIERLKSLKEANDPLRIERERKFLESLKSKLEVYASQNSARSADKARLWHMKALESLAILNLSINLPKFMQTKAIGIAALILALGAGSAAFGSQKSLPGDRLYPVKILAEEIRSELTIFPDSKAKLESEFAAKRIEEINQILSERSTEPKGLDIAIENLRKNSAKAADIIHNEEKKGKDVSELAEDISGKMDSNKEALKQIFKEQIKNLEKKEKALKKEIKEARKAGDAAAAESLANQLEALESRKENLEISREQGEDYIESESEDVQDKMKKEEKKMNQVYKAQKAISEAESGKQNLMDEFNKEKVSVDKTTLAEFDEIIAKAKDEFAKGNYEYAKNLAKEAEDMVDEIEKIIEIESLEMEVFDEYDEMKEIDDDEEENTTKENEAFPENASEITKKSKDKKINKNSAGL